MIAIDSLGRLVMFPTQNVLLTLPTFTVLRNYFLLFLRGVRRNKAYAAPNVGGLALGMAAFGITGVYVRQEYGYDRQHAAGDY